MIKFFRNVLLVAIMTVSFSSCLTDTFDEEIGDKLEPTDQVLKTGDGDNGDDDNKPTGAN